jgi:hypothetical protein
MKAAPPAHSFNWRFERSDVIELSVGIEGPSVGIGGGKASILVSLAIVYVGGGMPVENFALWKRKSR